jgi:hypothetical protein
MTEQAMSTENSRKFLTKNVVEFLNRCEKNVDLSRFNVDKSRTRIEKKIEASAYLEAVIITFQEWDGTSWVNTGRETIRYNADGNNLEVKIEVWDGTTFINVVRIVGTFDANGLLVLMLLQYGDAAGTGWIDYIRTMYTYDVHYFLVEELTEGNTGWTWISVYKTIYTNNPNGDPILIVDYTWNGMAWENEYQQSLTWTGFNLTQEIGQDWDGTAWVNDYKDDYTYDGFGNENTDIWQFWNGSAWENYYRWEGVFYSLRTPHYETYQYWNGSAWDYSEQYIYTYNASWYLTQEVYQDWGGSAWLNAFQWLYTYDGAWNQTKELEQEWIGSIWYNSSQVLSTWDRTIRSMISPSPGTEPRGQTNGGICTRSSRAPAWPTGKGSFPKRSP